MLKRSLLSVVAALAAVALFVPTSPVSAQDTGTLYVLHGINLDGQTAQADGGTAVTVCPGDASDDEPLLSDFQFGQFVPAGEFEVGAELELWVWLGADVPCDEDGVPELIQEYTVTAGTTVLVATGVTDDTSGFDFQLAPFAVDVDCTDPGTGRLTAAHASADTPEVTVVAGEDPIGTLGFGQQLELDLPVDTYEANVLLGGEPVFDPALALPVEEGGNTLAFVVGNLPDEGPNTAVVALAASVPTGVCDAPDPDPNGADPDPDGTDPDGPAPVAPGPGAPGAAAGERPLALTG